MMEPKPVMGPELKETAPPPRWRCCRRCCCRRRQSSRWPTKETGNHFGLNCECLSYWALNELMCLMLIFFHSALFCWSEHEMSYGKFTCKMKCPW
jgi:hypothetical protein